LGAAPGWPAANVVEQTATALVPLPLATVDAECRPSWPFAVWRPDAVRCRDRTQGRVCCRTRSKPKSAVPVAGRQRSSMSLRCQSRCARCAFPRWHVPPSDTYRSGLVHLVVLGDGQHLGLGATVEDRVGRLFGPERSRPRRSATHWAQMMSEGRRGRPDRTDLAAVDQVRQCGKRLVGVRSVVHRRSAHGTGVPNSSASAWAVCF